MRTLVVGEQPEGYDVGDAYHHVLMRILVAARTHGVAAIDGPYLKVRDVEAFRRVAGRSAALGYDGKWVLHPDQIAAGNEIFSPRQEDYDHAELILEAYEWHTSARGWRARRGDARRRDDRRGQPQDGVGDRGQGSGRGHGAQRRPVPAGRLRARPTVRLESADRDDECHQQVERPDRDHQAADDRPGQRDSVAVLTGAPGFAHRDDAEDEADDRRQAAARQTQQGCDQRSDGLAVGAGRLRRPVRVVGIRPSRDSPGIRDSRRTGSGRPAAATRRQGGSRPARTDPVAASSPARGIRLRETGVRARSSCQTLRNEMVQITLISSVTAPTAMPATARSMATFTGLLDLVERDHPEHDADDRADSAQHPDE